MIGTFPLQLCNGRCPTWRSGRSIIRACWAITWRWAPSQALQHVWATIERNPVGPNTLGAEEVAEFIDSLEAGGPPSAIRWLGDHLETIRAIYAIRIYPEAIVGHPEAEDAVFAVRSALRDAVGGIGQWDGYGFTNADDRLIWCDPRMDLKGMTEAAILDESTGEWFPFELNLDDPEELSAFLRGEIPKRYRHRIHPK